MSVIRQFFSIILMLTIIFYANTSAFAASKQNSSAIFNSAINNLQQQNYQQALLELTQTIETRPDLIAEAYSDRCLINIELNNYSAAAKDCKLAIKYNPDNWESHLNLGLAYYYLTNYSRAIFQYKRVIASNINDYRAYYNLGLVYAARAQYNLAIDNYNQALATDNELDETSKALIYNDLGAAQILLQDYSQAIANLDLAIKIQPNDYSAYFNRGCAHHRQGQYQAGIEDFSQVIFLRPNYTEAYVSRSILHHLLRHEQAAYRDIDIALGHYQTQGDHQSYQRVVSLKQSMIKSQIRQLA